MSSFVWQEQRGSCNSVELVLKYRHASVKLQALWDSRCGEWRSRPDYVAWSIHARVDHPLVPRFSAESGYEEVRGTAEALARAEELLRALAFWVGMTLPAVGCNEISAAANQRESE